MKWLYALVGLLYVSLLGFERYALGFGWTAIIIGMAVGVPLGLFVGNVWWSK